MKLRYPTHLDRKIRRRNMIVEIILALLVLSGGLFLGMVYQHERTWEPRITEGDLEGIHFLPDPSRPENYTFIVHNHRAEDFSLDGWSVDVQDVLSRTRLWETITLEGTLGAGESRTYETGVRIYSPSHPVVLAIQKEGRSGTWIMPLPYDESWIRILADRAEDGGGGGD